MKLKSSAYWGFLISALLLGLPSDFAWFRRPFFIILHEFDFFIGLLTPVGIHSPRWLFVVGCCIYMALMLVLGWSYYQMVLSAVDDTENPWSWKKFIPLLLPVFFYLPWLSPDVFFYFGTGWIQATHHFNPYIQSISEAPDFPNHALYTNILRSWKYIITPYGPLFSFFIRGLVQISGGNVFVCLLLLKTVFTALHLLNTRLACEIARALNMNQRATGLCFLLNPVLLICYIGRCHNDILLLTCCLAGILSLLQSRPVASLVCFAAGVGFKYVPILVVPFVLVYLLRGDWRPRSILKIASLAALFAVLMVLPNFLYQDGLANFTRLLLGRDQLLYNFLYILPAMLMYSWGTLDLDLIKMLLKFIFILIYFTLGIRLLWKGKKICPDDLFSTVILMFFFYFVIGSPEIHEWYAGWFILFIFWINRKSFFFTGHILSVALPTLAILTSPQFGVFCAVGWFSIFALLWYCLLALYRHRENAGLPSPLFQLKNI